MVGIGSAFRGKGQFVGQRESVLIYNALGMRN